MTTFSCRVDCPETGETRRFKSVIDAERYTRARVANTGGQFRISSLANGSNGQPIAIVRKDSLDRIWTDVIQTQNCIL